MDGCMTYGIDFEDALRNAEEALALYLEYMKERGAMPNPETYEDGGCIQFLALHVFLGELYFTEGMEKY